MKEHPSIPETDVEQPAAESAWLAAEEHLTSEQQLVLDYVACFPDGCMPSQWLIDLLRQAKGLPLTVASTPDASEEALLESLLATGLLKLDESADIVHLGEPYRRWRDARIDPKSALGKTIGNAVLRYLRERARPTPKNQSRPFLPREFSSVAKTVEWLGANGVPLSAVQIVNGVSAPMRKELGANVVEHVLRPLLNPPLLKSDDEARISHVLGLESYHFALRDLKRFADAEAAIDRAIAIMRRLRGPESGGLGMLIHSKALIASDQLRYGDAETLMWQAMAMRRKFFPENHPSFWAHHSILAVILMRQRKFADAAVQAERALAVSQKNDESEERIASDYYALAYLYQQSGQLDLALRTIDQSVQLSEQVFRPDSLKLRGRYLSRAKTLTRLKLWEQAKTAYEQLLVLDPPDDSKPLIRHCTALNDLGVVHFELGELTAAESHLRRSLSLRSALPEINPAESLTALRNLLGVLRRLDDQPGIAEVEQRIRSIKKLVTTEARARIKEAIDLRRAARAAEAVEPPVTDSSITE